MHVQVYPQDAEQGPGPAGGSGVHLPGWAPHHLEDICAADGNLAHQPALGEQIHFLPRFNKSEFEKETGNDNAFHLSINGDKM